MQLKNKNILVFYPKGATAHYGESIIEELKRRENFVTAYDERPSQSPIIKIATRLLKKSVPQFFANYIKRIIKNNIEKNFDFILVLRGEAFNTDSIKLLRIAYPKAELILYLWDVLDANNLTSILTEFDRRLSFDPKDSENQKDKNLIFRPTFYLNKFCEIPKKSTNYKYDVFFVGTLRPERYKLLRKIKNSIEKQNNNLFFYYYISSILVYFKNKIKYKAYTKCNEVSIRPMHIDEILENVQKSRCVLDLRYENQASLSMRAYETMAAQKKYITNNPNIIDYDFYNEENILIINNDNPEIPKEFIESDFVQIPLHIQNQYSIEQWVNDVFNLK